MIAMWMLRWLLAALLIALAARLADEAAGGFGWPRRWVWAGAFMLAASLPWLGGLLAVPSVVDALLVRWVPTVIAEAPAVGAEVTAIAVAGGAPPRRPPLDIALIGGWALASFALALVFGHAFWRLRVTRRRGGSTAARLEGFRLIRSDSLGPATVGIIRQTIVLPSWVDELPESERALIVSHEREHAMARDPLLLAAAALVVVAAPWCLPLWWMHRRLRDATETDCDARVLAGGADRLSYGRALLRAAARPRGLVLRFAAPLLGGVDVTRLERRILMMTQRRPKRPVLRAVPLIAVAAVAGAVACDAASDAVAAPDPATDRSAGSDEGYRIGEQEAALAIPENRLDLGNGMAVGRGIELEGVAVSGVSSSIRFDSVAPRSELTLRKVRIKADTSGVRSLSGEPMPGAEAEAVERAAVLATEHFQAEPQGHATRLSKGAAEGDPVFYIDGERVRDGAAVLKDLDPATIERIEVSKGKAVALYPPDHANGVVDIYLKKR